MSLWLLFGGCGAEGRVWALCLAADGLIFVGLKLPASDQKLLGVPGFCGLAPQFLVGLLTSQGTPWVI